MHSVYGSTDFGRLWDDDKRTGGTDVHLLDPQEHPDYRARLHAISGRVLQHFEPSNFQRTGIRRQRRGLDFELDQLQQYKLRPNWIDPLCPIRSEADSICSKAVLLS